VRAAAQFDVLERRQAAVAVRVDMVELEQATFAAAAAVGTCECAARAVARPDFATHFGWDMARRPAGCRPGNPLRPPRRFLRHLAELPLLQFRHQERQRPVDDLRRISVRDLMPQELLCEP